MARRSMVLGALLSTLLLGACSGEQIKEKPLPPPPSVEPAAIAALSKTSHLSPSHPEVKYPTPNKVIHLTFDDGPGEYTPQVLKILKEERVPATFFIIGRQVANYPNAIKEEKAQGMSMQVHTWDHIHTFPTLSLRGIDRQVNRTAQAIKKYSGITPSCVRPPEGATNPLVRRHLNKMGYGQILWDDDTEDWRRPGSKAILNTALSEARNGGIILMHDGGGNRSQDIAALPGIIHGLREKGYRFEPLCTTGAVKNLPW